MISYIKFVLGLLTTTLTLSTLVASPASAINSGDAVTYTQTITTPANPTGNFTGSSGLDTWSIGVDNGNIYGVVHIPKFGQDPMFRFTVVCNSIADGSVCTNYPVELNTYAINGGLADFYIDPVTHYLYSYATQNPTGTTAYYPDGNWGVLCFDTTTPLNPVCGFTPYLTKSGNPIYGGSKSLIYDMRMYSVPASTGVDQSIPAGGNVIACFDLVTKDKCEGQPFVVHPDAIAASDVGQILDLQRIGNSSKFLVNSVNKSFCFDMDTNTGCSGSWPLTLNWGTAPNTVSERSFAQFIPVLDANGEETGYCYTKASNSTWNCFDFTGAAISAPDGIATVLDPAWGTTIFDPQGENLTKDTYLARDPLQFGTRIYAMRTDTYVSNGSQAVPEASVLCFDYATNAACPNFSKHLTGAWYPYVFYTNPLQPTCAWVSSDQGPAQMQNFDLYTGGACGNGGSRILMSSFIEAGATCAPTSYGTLKINSPTDYTTAKVTLLDKNGASLGIAQQTFNGSREVDLSSLSLPTSSGSQPQMLIELRDGSNNLINSAIEASLSWEGSYNTSCVTNGQQAVASSGGGGGGNSGEITSADEVTVEEGELVLLQNETDITDPTWSLDGGADEDLFTITTGGKLKFKSAQPVGDYVVVVKAKNGSTEATITVTIHVVAQLEVGSPAPATRENASGGKTKIEWAEATNAVNYKVKLGKKVLCQSTRLTCKAKGQWLSNKKIYVYAYASNGDSKRALAVPQDADPVAGDKVKLGMVHFDLDSIFIDIRAVHKLDKFVAAIKQVGYKKIFVYGHTDNQGPAPHDISLSYRRARQVWMYLDKRLDNVKFVYKGFSRNEPAKPNTTEENLRFNRRVEVWATA